MPIPQHHSQFTRSQARTGGLRQTFRTPPEALPVIAQALERGAGAVPEDIECATEGIVAEGAATDGGEPIDAFPEGDRLRGDKDATLWGQLEHSGVSKNVRTNATSGGCGASECIRS